ncbi:Acetate--CoA ligase [ADP-forming] II subunit alpha [Candidatus Lokiarchaeum ossiferum]|uniref:Acetate--CoA ligase [ADP-forming] II subunit alpha n=1 Tax=Candidatus Lokiarchaeum ossiferum TaxID=2951803 RepID=A0ABY6HYW8_9ARCH|nr:Acetate--CoA ligase [ADP-forming] II subunit alpha [Candidatus Lokiarchaeum sp. B-35]
MNSDILFMPHIFFNPKSIAVIGATNNPKKFGNAVTKNLLKTPQLPVQLYFISKGTKEINHTPTFLSIRDIQDKIDLAIILVPAKFVESVIDECILKQVQRIIIVTAGFGEIDAQGKSLESIIAMKCRSAGIRVIGPNCVGIENVDIGLNASFIQTPYKGNISMVSQSGSFGGACIWEWYEQNIGCSKFANLGNQIDINFIDILKYYKEDKNSEVIAIYVEAIKEGRDFFNELKEITPYKPVIIQKGGRNPTGLAAASSHTGSIATNYNIFKTAVEQAGCVLCENMPDYITALKTFSQLPIPKGGRIAVSTSSGGSSVLFCDHAENFGLKLIDFSKTFIEKVRPHLIPLVKYVNPLDMIAGATEEQYYIVTKAMLEDPEIDIVVPCSLVPPFMDFEPQAHLRGIVRAWDETHRVKPVIPLMVFSEGFQEIKDLQKKSHIPVFFNPRETALAAKFLVERMNFLKRFQS